MIQCCLAIALLGSAGGFTQEPSEVLPNATSKLVHDPKLVESGPAMPPLPAGSVYSEWTVNGSNYVISYRNRDKDDPNDIVADIYLRDSQDGSLLKLISVDVFSQVDDVRLVSITGKPADEQLAFFRSSGQLQLIAIVSLHGRAARKLFEYGATSITVKPGTPEKIIAYSQIANLKQTFAWCATQKKIVLETKCK